MCCRIWSWRKTIKKLCFCSIRPSARFMLQHQQIRSGSKNLEIDWELLVYIYSKNSLRYSPFYSSWQWKILKIWRICLFDSAKCFIFSISALRRGTFLTSTLNHFTITTSKRSNRICLHSPISQTLYRTKVHLTTHIWWLI